MPVNKLADPLRYCHTARITCTQFNFPMDMLRYDRCTPCTTEDVVNMSRLQRDVDPTKTVVVTVVAYTRTKAQSPFTIGRWESFGCKVELV